MTDRTRYNWQERLEGRVYLTACEPEEPPSPPPPRPRSRSLPVSGYVGALARVARRNEDGASSQATDAAAPDATAPRSLSAFERLPFDLLSEILKTWMNDERANSFGAPPKTPFCALHVCKALRAAAKGTARLWVYPHFYFRRMLGNPLWIEYHAWFVQHAGELPFSVNLYNDIFTVPTDDVVWTYFRENIMVKARDIVLTISDPDADLNLLLPLRDYPLLETVRARFDGDASATYPMLCLALRGPRLKLLELDKIDAHIAAGADSSIEMIESLDITYEESSIQGLHGFAQKYRLLRECAFRLDSLHDQDCARFVWHGLETLHLTVGAIYGANDIPFRTLFPNLTTLGVRDYALHWPFWRYFIELSCPVLTRLVVHRNHMDNTEHLLSNLGDLAQIRTLVLRDGSLNNDIVTGLVQPLGALPMPFPGLTAVHFEDTVERQDFEWPTIRSALLLRSAYLVGRRERGPFVLTCKLKPRSDPPSHDAHRMHVEELVRQYNDAERKRVETIWGTMFPART